MIEWRDCGALSDEHRTMLRRRALGFVYQFHHLLPEFSAVENVMLPQMIGGVRRADARRKAEALLGRVGLAERLAHRPARLSGGEQQRVAIVRALANDPKILLLDEPFGALDNQTRALMQELLLGIWEADRKTVLFVTHDIDEAIFMANRVAVMSARPGRIKSELRIELPHPRHYTMKTSPEFSRYKAELTEQIRVEAMKAAQLADA